MGCKSEQAHLKHLIVPYLFMDVTHKTRIDSLFFQSPRDFFPSALGTPHCSLSPGGGGVLDTMGTARIFLHSSFALGRGWGGDDQESTVSK